MDLSDHSKSQELNLRKVTKYLQKNNFSDIRLEQEWRHVTGSVVKNGITMFFKLASTEKVAKKTKNEFEWNKLINSKRALPIAIPRNYESGNYNGLFWFTSEYIDGKPIAIVSQKEKTKSLENNLAKIALTSKSILEMNTKKRLPNDETDTNKREDRQKIFLDRMKHWMNQFDNDVDDLYAFIKERIRFIQKAPSHGDFVPWHIFMTGDKKLFLIDGEHSKAVGFKFYDVAYFYHRVYTKLKRPDIAANFLGEFINIYPFIERDKECFRLVLAQRIIGGYMDAKNDSRISIELQHELMDRVLEDRIPLS
jgi:hypothetical protein